MKKPDASAKQNIVERIERNDAGQLVVHVAGRGEPIVDAKLARCFPWSLPDAYISVRDPGGKEIALLETLAELDDSSRLIADRELQERIFNPKITRITDYRSEFGVTTVVAQTDRGEVSFQIRSRDDIRMLGPMRMLFRDVDGNTYEVADVAELDRDSRKHLEQYL